MVLCFYNLLVKLMPVGNGLQIGGIGKVTEHILKDALGIKTCEEMVQKGSLLYALFSQSSAGSSISSFLFYCSFPVKDSFVCRHYL